MTRKVLLLRLATTVLIIATACFGTCHAEPTQTFAINITSTNTTANTKPTQQPTGRHGLLPYDVVAANARSVGSDGDTNLYRKKNHKQSIRQRGIIPYGEQPRQQPPTAFRDATPLAPAELVQVLPDRQHLLTINDIYFQNQADHNSAYAAGDESVRKKVHLFLPFERNYDQWNPRNNNTQWTWFFSSSGNDTLPADNAAFVRHSAAGSAHENERAYENNKASAAKPQTEGFVELISEPYVKWLPNDDPAASTTYNEGYPLWNGNVSVSNRQQRTLFRMKFACKTVNADRHPFPATLVANAWNDPRLTSCGFQVYDDVGNFYIFDVTNTGVWAVYGFFVDDDTLAFKARRLVGVRKSYHDVVDAGIEYDGRRNAVNFYLNGYRVWTINQLGMPPHDDGVTKIDLGKGAPSPVVTPSTLYVGFGTQKCLDESDPNNAASNIRLVRLLPPNSSFYGANDTFYDNDSLQSNNLWGQGADMILYKLLIVTIDSVPVQPRPLPGVYLRR